MAKANVGVAKKDWKPPAGYESAIAKARKAARSASPKPKAKAKAKSGARRKVQAVTQHDEEDTASDSEASDGQFCPLTRFRPVTHGTPINLAAVQPSRNRAFCPLGNFSALDTEQEYDLEALNLWAHRVVKKSEQTTQKKAKTKASVDPAIARAANYVTSNRRPKDRIVVVQTEKDIEKISEFVKPLPEDRKSMSKVFRKVDKISLARDEKLVMIDSGSFCHAINAEKELPNHSVHPIKGSDDGHAAESACGSIMKQHGRVKTICQIGSTTISLKWNAMDVKVPILSVRRLCRDNKNLTVGFSHTGGYMINTLTKERIEILEFQGVYFVIMKVLPPTPSNAQTEPVFSRPVTAA